MMYREGEEVVVCPVCGRRLEGRWSLARHMTTSHGSEWTEARDLVEGLFRFQCGSCGRTFLAYLPEEHTSCPHCGEKAENRGRA